MGTAGYPNGMRIRLLRVEHDITAKDLAERIGISRRHLYNVERGRTPASVGVLLKISEVFSVPLDDLIVRGERAAKAA